MNRKDLDNQIAQSVTDFAMEASTVYSVLRSTGLVPNLTEPVVYTVATGVINLIGTVFELWHYTKVRLGAEKYELYHTPDVVEEEVEEEVIIPKKKRK